MIYKIVPDTNFLIYVFKHKINFDYEIERALNAKFEIVILSPIKEELEKLLKSGDLKGKEKLAVNLALAKIKNYKLINCSGYADDAILNYANTFDKDIENIIENSPFANSHYDDGYVYYTKDNIIYKVDVDEIPNGTDLIVGGFPCLGFAVAKGKSRNINDSVNFLYKEYIRILKAKMTKYFLIENVPGMKSGKEFNNFFENMIK